MGGRIAMNPAVRINDILINDSKVMASGRNLGVIEVSNLSLVGKPVSDFSHNLQIFVQFLAD